MVARKRVRKKMLHLTRSLMDLGLENNRIKEMVRDGCNVGHVVRRISREIVCKIKVVDLRFTVYRKRRQLGMLGREFHGSMQHWITSKWITRHVLSRMDSKICDKVVCILIGPGSNYSYVNPDLVDKCGLNKEVYAKSWLMHLATCTKERVHHWVRACTFDLNGGMPISTHLNVLPFGSFNILLGMDWLYLHRTNVDCYDKAIECLDDNGEQRILQGKKKATLARMVIAMQA